MESNHHFTTIRITTNPRIILLMQSQTKLIHKHYEQQFFFSIYQLSSIRVHNNAPPNIIKMTAPNAISNIVNENYWARSAR
jgi:hypothetical protein